MDVAHELIIVKESSLATMPKLHATFMESHVQTTTTTTTPTTTTNTPTQHQ